MQHKTPAEVAREEMRAFYNAEMLPAYTPPPRPKDLTDHQRVVLNAIKQITRPFRAQEVADAIGHNRKSVASSLKAITTFGYAEVFVIGRGFYSMQPPAPQPEAKAPPAPSPQKPTGIRAKIKTRQVVFDPTPSAINRSGGGAHNNVVTLACEPFPMGAAE